MEKKRLILTDYSLSVMFAATKNCRLLSDICRLIGSYCSAGIDKCSPMIRLQPSQILPWKSVFTLSTLKLSVVFGFFRKLHLVVMLLSITYCKCFVSNHVTFCLILTGKHSLRFNDMYSPYMILVQQIHEVKFVLLEYEFYLQRTVYSLYNNYTLAPMRSVSNTAHALNSFEIQQFVP